MKLSNYHLEVRRHARWLWFPAFALLLACDSSLVREAKNAESKGRTISNDMMKQLYPSSFRPGEPPYLERDFEAGADFICDEIELKLERDVCSEAQIKWR